MTIHKSVLLKEVTEGLNLKDNFTVVDSTLGGGGHSREILNLYPNIKIIAIDKENIAFERSGLSIFKNRISFNNTSFENIDEVLKKEKIKEVDAILFDLGLSSDELDNSKRGFSFLRDEDLLMTMKDNLGEDDLTAKEIVNTWEEDSLRDIIYGYGEEKFAKRIARGIVEQRNKKEIKTTFDLVKIIMNSVPSSYKKGKIHPTTKTFQALRIAVNNELEGLKIALEKSLKSLKKGGRIAVISFHSLEDRIVKNFYKEKKNEGIIILINKKPIIPSKEEIINNKRSRSAKLRILEKIL